MDGGFDCEDADCDGALSCRGDGGPLVIIPTMTEWGMIFATIILGMFAVLRLRRKASE